MAITTYSELLTALSNWQGHDDSESSRYPEFIAMFESCFNRVARVRQMESDTTLTLAATVASLPSDYLMWRSVRWKGVTPFRDLKYIHPKYIGGPYIDQITGSTTNVFSIVGTQIYVNDSVANDIGMRYYAKVPALTSSNTTNWLLTAYPDVYVAGCLAEAAALRRDDAGFAAWKQRRDEMIGEIAVLSAYSQGEDAMRIPDSLNDLDSIGSGYF